MKSAVFTGLVTAALGGLLAAAAAAQTTAPVQKPISIKLGAYFPTGSQAKHLNNTWFTAGADYAFSKTDEAAPVEPLAYVDYTGSSKNGVKASLVGVGVGVRAYGQRATNTQYAPYYGLGVGAYFLHGDDGNGNSANKTRLGGKAFAGVELNQGVFAEVAYNLVGKVQGIDPSGITVAVGVRF